MGVPRGYDSGNLWHGYLFNKTKKKLINKYGYPPIPIRSQMRLKACIVFLKPKVLIQGTFNKFTLVFYVLLVCPGYKQKR